jgi:hypothetical protein
MEMQGELLELAEQIAGEVVGHPLSEADVAVARRHPDQPAQQEYQHDAAHAPADEVG